MSSIEFFSPVSYNSPTKTISQKILENVDEFFYLGNKVRVKIFTSDTKYPQFRALQDRQGRHRSWTNIAIKISLYCTLILPLIGLFIKAALRFYLQIPFIQLESQFLPSSEMETMLSSEILQQIGSFLNAKDHGQWIQVAFFARHSVDMHVHLMKPLKAEIQALPAGPLNPESFQRLLTNLVTSSAIDQPKHWAPVMDALMKHKVFKNDLDGFIESHADIANLLGTAAQSISPDQIYHFCRYLGLKKLSNTQVWVGYQVFEQYLMKPNLDSKSVKKALNEYLTEKADIIQVESKSYQLSNDRILNFQEIDIDPRTWFGFSNHLTKYSLWELADVKNGKMASIPQPLLEVLWTRIQSLHDSCKPKLFVVCMEERNEARLPYNFTLELAQLITNSNIFISTRGTINKQKLNLAYAQSLTYLSHDEMENVAQQYPEAVTSKWG